MILTLFASRNDLCTSSLSLRAKASRVAGEFKALAWEGGSPELMRTMPETLLQKH